MLAHHAAELETLTTIDDIWANAQMILSQLKIDFLNYVTVQQRFTEPFVLSNILQIYGDHAPERDPFLSHCCESYEITRTGVAYLPDYQFLPPDAKRFIVEAERTGFQTGLGIPMRLRGSKRFGGFNLGTRLDRKTFESEIVPKAEELRMFCLILHRRIEELHDESCAQVSHNQSMAKGSNSFRKLMIAPERRQTDNRVHDLSQREQEVAYLIASGLSRKECARLCGISPHTVSEYIKSIYRKLDVNDRVKLAHLLNNGS